MPYRPVHSPSRRGRRAGVLITAVAVATCCGLGDSAPAHAKTAPRLLPKPPGLTGLQPSLVRSSQQRARKVRRRAGRTLARTSAWAVPSVHGAFSAIGNCNTYYTAWLGLNSRYAYGDRLTVYFTLWVQGVGWTPWTAPYVYDVPQAPNVAWRIETPFYLEPAGTRWVTAYMAVKSAKAGGGYIGADYLLTQKPQAGDLSEIDGIYCRNRY